MHHFTVDVEEYFHAGALRGEAPRCRWENLESRVERSVDRLLELLDRHGARGTFFVLGWVARRHPDLVRRVASCGHEIASHGWAHRCVAELEREEFRQSVRSAKSSLEDVTGEEVAGYRAPNFSISPGMEWALDILVEEGHRYDSSLFPVRRPGYGYPGGGRASHRLEGRSGTLMEFPPATLRWLGLNLPAGGGAYFRLLPYRFVSAAFEDFEVRGLGGVFYIHPWEIDPGQPRFDVPWATRVRHYGGLERTSERLSRLLREFSFRPIRDALDDETPVRRPDHAAGRGCSRPPGRAAVARPPRSPAAVSPWRNGDRRRNGFGTPRGPARARGRRAARHNGGAAGGVKGVVLAGGSGTRLAPMTRVVNKHLLPVFDRPMVFYPIQTLVRSGVRDILVVTGGEHAGGFLRLLGDGREIGARRLHFAYQEGEGGIADALGRAEAFAAGDPIMVLLGDNVFEHDLSTQVARFQEAPDGARVLLKEVGDPERYGVAEVEGDRVVRIVEKPTVPPSSYAVVGAYLYDSRVFEIIRSLEPSDRGELEITDVNNRYLEMDLLSCDFVDGWWIDAGTPESLLEAAARVAGDRPRQPAGV